MEVLLAQWGNSLGLRIPKDIAAKAGLSSGVRVEIKAESNRVIITATRPRYTMDELLVGVTPGEMQEAFDWGTDAGRESVE